MLSYQLTREDITYCVKLNSIIPTLIGILSFNRRTRPNGQRVFGHDAETFFRTVYVRDAACPANMHAHEFVHVRQYSARPWTFGLSYQWDAIRKGYPKAPAYNTGNRYEVEAYGLELTPSFVATFTALPPI